jgi:hypothetical protein
MCETEMAITAETFILSAAVVAFAYPIAMRFIARAVQPSRLEMAALGDELLTSPHISEIDKGFIEMQLDEAFDWRDMLMIMIVIPIMAPKFILDRPDRYWPNIQDEAVRKKFERFFTLSYRSASAANPICAVVCSIEFALLGLILVPLGRLAWQLPFIVDAARRSDRMLDGKRT